MRRNRTYVVAAVALAVLAGCGSGGDTTADAGPGKVATLRSAAAEPSATVPAAAQRPRERLDTTDEDLQQMLKPYNKCLVEHGVDPGTDKRSASDTILRIGTPEEKAEMEAANKICEPLHYPLPPWEKDPANPESRDFALAVVKCLKKKGVEYVAVAEDGVSYALGGDRNDAKSISLGMEKAPECEREVAAANK